VFVKLKGNMYMYAKKIPTASISAGYLTIYIRQALKWNLSTIKFKNKMH